ncbi:hypothetical protein D3C85_1573630 [compost metagenome]
MLGAMMPATLVPCFKRLPRCTRQPELPTGIDAVAAQRLLRQTMNRGQVCRNRGIVLAQGKQPWIALLDEPSQRIENLMRHSRRNRLVRCLSKVRQRTNG